MKKITIACFILFALCQITQAQSPADSLKQQKIKDSIATAIRDSLRLEMFDKIGTNPLLDVGKWSKVLPVTGIDELPDTTHDYRLLFDLVGWPTDSTHEKPSYAFEEMARIINLHIAAGIPQSRIKIAIIGHGPSINGLLNDSSYNIRFKKPNPNSKPIRDLMKIGAHFMVCGQSMVFFEFKKPELTPGVKMVMAARTATSDYISRGYVRFEIKSE